METILAILPWLVLLACPITMFLMMRAMPGGDGHNKWQDGRVKGGGDMHEQVEAGEEVAR